MCVVSMFCKYVIILSKYSRIILFVFAYMKGSHYFDYYYKYGISKFLA